MPSLSMFIARFTICTSTLLATSIKPSSTTLVRAFSIRIPQQRQLATFTSPLTLTTSTRKMSTSATTEGSSTKKKRVLVPIAEDSEEIETTCITDVLTRFGAEVVVASVKPDGDLVCKMSRGIKIMADVTIEQAAKEGENWDLIALPGGMPGAEYLRDCPILIDLLKKQKEEKKLYGAVCASPAVVLASKGLLGGGEGGGATCYPADPFRAVIDNASDDSVVVQENVVTSQGPGTSLLFALSLGEQLYGKEEADKIASALLVER